MIPRLVLALRFLTRLPVPGPCAPFEELGKCAACFPAAGLVIGALVAAAAASAGHVGGSPAVGALAAIVANLLITGGLHLDGLMDTCDGLFGTANRERALEIMRDPRVGSFGALAGMVALLTRFLFGSGPDGVPWQALLLAPVVGRCAQVWAVACFPYARAQGTGKAFDGATGRPQLVAAALSAGAICLLVAGPAGLEWLALGWLAGAAVAWRIQKRLEGLTGDSYGALTEVAEWAVLAAAWVSPAMGCPAWQVVARILGRG